VFISHTSELRDFPKGKASYVAEVERAISAAGHVIVDMADFPAADQPAAQLCIDRVRGCVVYVGVLGTRYGSPVRDMPQVSYTELEFDTATQARMDRLVFLLDTDADDLGIPASKLIDHEFGGRQAGFRDWVQDSALVTQSFDNPDMLGKLVERSLRELADTRARIGNAIVREQVPGGPQPVRASKFINPPPAIAPVWFQDRQVETGLLAGYVTNPIAASLIRELKAAFGAAELLNGFGMTETSSLVAALPHRDVEEYADSVGYAVPGVDLAVGLSEGSPRASCWPGGPVCCTSTGTARTRRPRPSSTGGCVPATSCGSMTAAGYTSSTVPRTSSSGAGRMSRAWRSRARWRAFPVSRRRR
jgi:hypothetical protein